MKREIFEKEVKEALNVEFVQDVVYQDENVLVIFYRGSQHSYKIKDYFNEEECYSYVISNIEHDRVMWCW